MSSPSIHPKAPQAENKKDGSTHQRWTDRSWGGPWGHRQRPRLREKGSAWQQTSGHCIHSLHYHVLGVYYVPGTVLFSGNTAPESSGRDQSTPPKWISFKEAATCVGRNWKDVQILTCECQVPRKGSRLLGEMVDSKIEAERVQEQPALALKSKEGLREQWGYVKRTEEPGWRGSHWSSEPVTLPSHVQFFATPWTIAYQAPPSMEFSRKQDWSGLPFPSPGDLTHPKIEPRSPTLQADALLSELPGKP